MEKSIYKSGTLLKRNVTDLNIPEYQKVFIHDGYVYPDGIGCLIGFEDGKLVHSSGFNNMCFSLNVTEPTQDEAEEFMLALMYQDFIKYR